MFQNRALIYVPSIISSNLNRRLSLNDIHQKKVEKIPSACKKPEPQKSCAVNKGSRDAPAKKPQARKTVKVYKFDGIESKRKPYIQTYDLDTTGLNMILDLLLKLKEMDPGLTFRKSCREGICGSCAVNVQGTNCLGCITAIPDDATIKIYPLPHMYVIRDLVVDMTHFFRGYDSIRPYLIREKQIELGSTQYAQSMNDNSKMIGLYECVLCACCSTSCPSYWWNGRRFLGPASLLHAYRWIIDSRDDAAKERMRDLNDDFRAFRCHSIFNCHLVCPKGLMPGRNIAKLKRLISGVDKKSESEMDPLKYAQRGATKSRNEYCK